MLWPLWLIVLTPHLPTPKASHSFEKLARSKMGLYISWYDKLMIGIGSQLHFDVFSRTLRLGRRYVTIMDMDEEPLNNRPKSQHSKTVSNQGMQVNRELTGVQTTRRIVSVSFFKWSITYPDPLYVCFRTVIASEHIPCCSAPWNRLYQ